jgi:uncharacterized protein YdeI (YjbR/CyaY-like superfamily)
LEQHYAQEKEIWLIFYKARTGKSTIAYEEAVQEALCFGWIDSLVKKIDEESYARKFTPRTDKAKWSVSNKRRVAKLIREGRKTETGLAKINDLSDFREDLEAGELNSFEIPAEVESGLRSSPLAWNNFCRMTLPSQRLYIRWITSAKRSETVQKRIRESIERLEQNLPLGLK